MGPVKVNKAVTVLLGAVSLAAVGAPRALPAAPAAAAARQIVVAPGGHDTGAGSLEDPLATIQAAVDRSGPGDTIAVRGGVYELTDNITIATSGTAGSPITLTNYSGEHVVIDGERLPASHTPVGGSIPRAERGAIHQEASYWRIRGLEIVHGPYGIYCAGCNDNEFTGLTTRDNYESGFQLQGASSRNLIANLDSYGNRDPRKNGESADGLAVKEGQGEGNRVRGPGCGTTRTTASTPGSSPPPSPSRTRSRTATGSTGGTSPTSPVTATASSWAAVAMWTRRRPFAAQRHRLRQRGARRHGQRQPGRPRHLPHHHLPQRRQRLPDGPVARHAHREPLAAGHRSGPARQLHLEGQLLGPGRGVERGLGAEHRPGEDHRFPRGGRLDPVLDLPRPPRRLGPRRPLLTPHGAGPVCPRLSEPGDRAG
ncbi:hypothetical protein SAZ11_55545 [Streptomyces sp. FXJ1.4098]|nr:hypothetical protein [Streptomyces sp. FXJ1.4098]